MKRLAAIILIAALLLLLLPAASGCAAIDDGKTTVICTVFPIYDWVRNVVGQSSNIEVKLIVSNGSDLHSYQPTADDIIDIRQAELIVRGGGEDDGFVNDVLPDCKNIADLRLMEAEGVVLHHTSNETHTHEEGHDHHHENDEHIWLSLSNAISSVEAICDAVCALDPENAESYRANSESYKASLYELDSDYREAVSEATDKKLLFADRFPFVYMTEDYGIEFCAAFEGCGTESDASFDVLMRLAQRLDAWELPFVSVTESSDGELAGAVIKASKAKNAQILVFDSMQSVTDRDISAGKTYIGAMKSNLAVLKVALGVE